MRFPNYLCVIVALVSLFIHNEVTALTDCTKILEEAMFAGQCNNKWKNVKPVVKRKLLLRPCAVVAAAVIDEVPHTSAATQSEVGYAWIRYKIEKDFVHESMAQSAMDGDGAIPAVIGPGPAIYVVDDHHTLSALDYSGFDDVSVTFNVICDHRTMSTEDFWDFMRSNHFAYLAAHPHNEPNSMPAPVSYLDLPARFSFTSKDAVFADDPWRSLAGYSRKLTSEKCPKDAAYCLRCMYRGCGAEGKGQVGAGVYYFEFQWSYFFNDASYNKEDGSAAKQYWPTAQDHSIFVDSYIALPPHNVSTLSAIDVAAWMTAASNLFPLCRAENTPKYRLPRSIYGTDDKALPGVVTGSLVQLPDDPTCDASFCPALKRL